MVAPFNGEDYGPGVFGPHTDKVPPVVVPKVQPPPLPPELKDETLQDPPETPVTKDSGEDG